VNDAQYQDKAGTTKFKFLGDKNYLLQMVGLSFGYTFK
jgi:hypothetical protein